MKKLFNFLFGDIPFPTDSADRSLFLILLTILGIGAICGSLITIVIMKLL